MRLPAAKQSTREPNDENVRDHVFGYTLVSDWRARSASGDPMPTSDGLPISIGPCVVTADEVDPQTMFLEVRIDGEGVAKGNLNGAARNLMQLIAASSTLGELERGDAFALTPFGADGEDPGRQLWPGAVIELAAEGIGTLRNVLGART